MLSQLLLLDCPLLDWFSIALTSLCQHLLFQSLGWVCLIDWVLIMRSYFSFRGSWKTKQVFLASTWKVSSFLLQDSLSIHFTKHNKMVEIIESHSPWPKKWPNSSINSNLVSYVLSLQETHLTYNYNSVVTQLIITLFYSILKDLSLSCKFHLSSKKFLFQSYPLKFLSN